MDFKSLGGPVLALMGLFLVPQPSPPGRVGNVDSHGTLVATGQYLNASGRRISVLGKLVEIIPGPGDSGFVTTTTSLLHLDIGRQTVANSIKTREGTSLTGLALSHDHRTVFVSNSRTLVQAFSTGNRLREQFTIRFGKSDGKGDPAPCGLALDLAERHLFVALSRWNRVAEVDLATGEVVRFIKTAPCPFAVALLHERLIVSCWGRKPLPNSAQADSSGTSVKIDGRGISIGGTLMFFHLGSGSVVRREVGGQVTCIVATARGTVLAVSSVADDFTEWNEAGRQLARINLRAIIGKSSIAPSAILEDVNTSEIYVACGDINSIAVFSWTKSGYHYRGLIPTDWYPIGLALIRNRLLIANSKGLGAENAVPSRERNVYQFSSSVTQLGLPLSAFLASTAGSLASASGDGLDKGDDKLVRGLGFKHIFYILKENRTYDQVLGDLPSGDGDPKLAIFGRSVTPNQHALAEQFVLLDNYYCNGICSADGHAWAMEGHATGYFERAFGGWTRSYPYGDDPLSVSDSGFIWDAVLRGGHTFRNYGEFDSAINLFSYRDTLKAFRAGRHLSFSQKIDLAPLRKYSAPDYPGWNLTIPDEVRASRFKHDFGQRCGNDSVAEFNIVYLPQDHTAGGNKGFPSPAAMVADNDRAVGSVVETISHSNIWRTSVIFVVEDDPQDGFDHVDGHRSACLVVSPFTRGRGTVSNFYNQTAVLRTVECILGLAPMNGFDAESPIMSRCFDSKLDLTPYTALLPVPPKDSLQSLAGLQAPSGDISRPDRLDCLQLNRYLWGSMRGSAAYPSQFEGSHGTGLLSKRLRLLPKSGQNHD